MGLFGGFGIYFGEMGWDGSIALGSSGGGGSYVPTYYILGF